MHATMRTAASEQPRPIRSVAIVGRGFTGVAVAAALIERAELPLTVYLIDRDDTVGGGAAYGRPRAGELLNVRTQALSLLASAPGEFARWLSGDDTWGGYPDTEDLRQVFAPRAAFGDYVRARFAQIRAARPATRVAMVEGEATRIVPVAAGGFWVEVEGCEPLETDAVVLATGYGDPESGAVFGRSPFAPVSPELAAAARRVALVGSGLTMIDVWKRLRDAGCRAHVEVFSHHGRLPLPHTPLSPRPLAPEMPAPTSATALFAAVRRACAAALVRGESWQAVMNGLRPATRDLWCALPLPERKRLWRHARWAWTIHRHRMPYDVHQRLAADIAEGGTSVTRARVIGVHDERTVWIAAERAGDPPRQVEVDLAVDCSGHRPDLRSALVKSLIRERLAEKDALGRGLGITREAEIVAPDGRTVSGLFAAGPLGEGSLLEITGAPEIVEQAAEIAARLLPASGAGAARAGEAG